MIQVIDNRTNQTINDFPTVRATAAFCVGAPNLWEYAFWDTERRRWVSWVEIENLIEKLNNSGTALFGLTPPE